MRELPCQCPIREDCELLGSLEDLTSTSDEELDAVSLDFLDAVNGQYTGVLDCLRSNSTGCAVYREQFINHYLGLENLRRVKNILDSPELTN